MARRCPTRARTYPAARYVFWQGGRSLAITVADDGPGAFGRAVELAAQDGRLTPPFDYVEGPTHV